MFQRSDVKRLTVIPETYEWGTDMLLPDLYSI